MTNTTETQALIDAVEAFITGLGWHEDSPARAWLLAVLRAMLTQK